MAYQRAGTKNTFWTVASGDLVTGVVVLALGATGALIPMVMQAIIALLVAGSPSTLPEHFYRALITLGYGSVLLPVALYDWGHALVHDFRERWWIPVGGVVLTFQVLFINLDGSTDVALWLAFVALGVAIAVDLATARWSVAEDHRSHKTTRTNRHPLLVALVM